MPRRTLAYVLEVSTVIADCFVESLTVWAFRSYQTLPVRLFSTFLFTSWNILFNFFWEKLIWFFFIFIFCQSVNKRFFLRRLDFINLFNLKIVLLGCVIPKCLSKKIWSFITKVFLLILFKIVQFYLWRKKIFFLRFNIVLSFFIYLSLRVISFLKFILLF